jgi:uncharacterized protein involved in exopolysaccharide biosynthesis
MSPETHHGATSAVVGPGLQIDVVLARFRRHGAKVLLASVLAAAIGYAATFFLKPVFTASTLVMPPQQSQSGGLAALASLGSVPGLSSLVGGGLKNSGDQYIALLQSVTVAERIINHFNLKEVYDEKFMVDTRRELAENVRARLSKKDGMITIDVDDTDPQRAADIANRLVVELERMTDTLAVTEAQQRRVFFEKQLKLSREKLSTAQQKLLASGFNPDTLKAEPRAAADQYARRKAEVSLAEVQLQALRQSLTDSAPEVRAKMAAVSMLRSELSRLEQQTQGAPGTDYVGAYREFKYEEVQFEMLARQLELARIDESREGALIQVVDAAQAPEKRSRPKRTLIALAAGVMCMVLLSALIILVPQRRLAKSGI